MAALMTFAEFSTKPFVQKACSTSPMTPKAVLSFFFGVDYLSGQHLEAMEKGTPLTTMSGIWFAQSDDYDAMCCNSFGPVVRAAGNKELTTSDWTGSVDGLMSQVLLCDQLSRNCFRGTEEAFRYDCVAEEISLKMIDDFQKVHGDTATATNEGLLPGTFYPPYISFLVVPLMHSEDVANHELGLQVLDLSAKIFEEDIAKLLDNNRSFLLDHKKVLDRFGRYPHRNAKLGRTNTPDEQAWLDDVDNLPGWAKSQL